MSADEFAPLNDAIDDLAARLSGTELRALGRTVATDLRSANAKRIRANVTPEGEAMVPRKSVRMAAMFQRATAPRYLRRESSQGEAQVGFTGAMARIMRVHHFGLKDRVTRAPGSPQVTYPARALLGITAEDRLRILDTVEAAIAP